MYHCIENHFTIRKRKFCWWFALVFLHHSFARSIVLLISLSSRKSKTPNPKVNGNWLLLRWISQPLHFQSGLICLPIYLLIVRMFCKMKSQPLFVEMRHRNYNKFNWNPSNGSILPASWVESLEFIIACKYRFIYSWQRSLFTQSKCFFLRFTSLFQPLI